MILIVQFGFLILIGMSMLVTWILPSLNLHFANMNNQNLRRELISIIDENRNNISQLDKELDLIKMNGIKNIQVRSEEKSDFIIYQIDFSYSNLFEDLKGEMGFNSSTHSMNFIVDKN